MSLSQEEIDACHEAFREVDVNRRGHIDVWELRIVLQGERAGNSIHDKELDRYCRRCYPDHCVT